MAYDDRTVLEEMIERTAPKDCPRCEGSGGVEFDHTGVNDCPDCKGTGRALEERRWIIQVCDECDELFDGVENHRHREGVHGIGVDVEVVPDEPVEMGVTDLASLSAGADDADLFATVCQERDEAEAALREINEHDVSPEVQKILDVALVGKR